MNLTTIFIFSAFEDFEHAVQKKFGEIKTNDSFEYMIGNWYSSHRQDPRFYIIIIIKRRKIITMILLTRAV
jgi:hypothetical protein